MWQISLPSLWGRVLFPIKRLLAPDEIRVLARGLMTYCPASQGSSGAGLAPDFALGSRDDATEPWEAAAGVREIGRAGAQQHRPAWWLLEAVQQGQGQQVDGIHGL
jgi:hypothetical protein